MTESDEHGVPILRGVSAHLGALERRAEYLDKQLFEQRGSRVALQFAQAELQALRAAGVALKYHRNSIERMDEPLGLLAEVVAAYEGPVDKEGRLRGIVERAKLVLEEFET